MRPLRIGRVGAALVGVVVAATVGLSGPAPVAADEVRGIIFPVYGGASWVDTFGACRGVGCERSHEGQDLFAPKLTPLLAAVEGTVTSVGRNGELSGNSVTIQDAEGWRYLYLHINNDRPGTDDGSDLDAFAYPPGIYVGAKVYQGQTIGYLGDSGNAETTPSHLHFEIRDPSGVPINAAASLRGAPGWVLDPAVAQAHMPFGVWDATVLDPGGVHVIGWAVDPDSSASLQVEAWVDDIRVQVLQAGRSRPDVAGALPGKGVAHGLDGWVPVNPGDHRLCLYARNDDRGPAGSLGCRIVNRPFDPFGFVDGVQRVPGGVRIDGWAIDADTVSPILVHAYAGSDMAGAGANGFRPDVAVAHPIYGPAHGFSIWIPTGPGPRNVCAYGINIAPVGANASVGCRPFVVESDPFGFLDHVAPAEGGVRVAGWALDPDAVGPIEVHVYVDGVGHNLGLADDPRPDVAGAFPAWSIQRGFDATVPAPGGSHEVCAFAINVVHGGNVLLGCTRV